MADRPPYPGAGDDREEPGGGPTPRRPPWSKILVAVLVVFVALLFIALHLAGVAPHH